MEVFFYGLFMDNTILKKNGISASNPRKGYLQDYSLKIGRRASLIPMENEKSYGILMTVDDESVHQLYSEPSVADYLPEEVNIVTLSGEKSSAACYNLPLELLDGTNNSYVQSLYNLAKKLNFPSDYLQKIKSQSD